DARADRPAPRHQPAPGADAVHPHAEASRCHAGGLPRRLARRRHPWRGTLSAPGEMADARLVGPKITEYYGGTESGFLTVITGDEWIRKPGSVGRATPLAEIIIVKDDGTLAGPNEPGQIYFRSRSGADFHYHKDPTKTEAAHREPGVGTLGDVGYLDDDGYLFMSDRKIDMIISGGVNIYPAEIESVLVTHPAVQDAAVFGIPNDEFGEEVKAAVELAPGCVPS